MTRILSTIANAAKRTIKQHMLPFCSMEAVSIRAAFILAERLLGKGLSGRGSAFISLWFGSADSSANISDYQNRLEPIINRSGEHRRLAVILL